jgi:hypothetical protein
MDAIDIYRGQAFLVTINPENSSTQNKQVMGDNTINLDFKLNHYTEFIIGDSCSVFGLVYTLHDMPVITKTGTYEYTYKMAMRSAAADLLRVQYLFLDPADNLNETDFSLMGNAQTFANLLLKNLNRVVSGFAIGQVIDTVYKNISFSKDTCSSALAKIADAFSTEWWIEGKLIHVTTRSRDTGITFRHGKNKGLYEITRSNLNNTGIFTRLYAFGSDRNLPPDYFSSRLRLPGGFVPCLISNLTCIVSDLGGGLSNFAFAWNGPTAPGVTGVDIIFKRTIFGIINTIHAPIGGPYELQLPTGEYQFIFKTIGGSCGNIATLPVILSASTIAPLFVNSPLPYLEQNTDLYGVIEATEIFDDIYPHRTGKVTAVDVANPFLFSDDGIDFDINQQLMPGSTAKVTFNTGQLSGYTLDIVSFNPITKEVAVLKNKQDNKLSVPSDLIRPAIGDEYVFTDINMPTNYITAAENDLLTAAKKLLATYCRPQVSYSIVLDPKFVRMQKVQLDIGDNVYIKDDQLEINQKIRVVQLVRNIVEEDNYQVELSEVVTQGTIQQIVNIAQQNMNGINDLSKQIQQNVLLNGTVVGDLKFDKGTAILPDMPTTADIAGFSQVYVEISTGKLFRKV